ncbi:glycoside hydrolase family 16, putative [Babesia ovata]|uniref:Glycoside hydrolase family 16, putative n=1 Tax=Babesia ovata TaxID=189622 RepID=A0A2H6K687_9APIC|nr:glycoside hydrolase family 16, putative [Babesia ovata]GBE58516.1 glycoside hydrolase family 16, putative [Babesia ovata]
MDEFAVRESVLAPETAFCDTLARLDSGCEPRESDAEPSESLSAPKTDGRLAGTLVDAARALSFFWGSPPEPVAFFDNVKVIAIPTPEDCAL